MEPEKFEQAKQALNEGIIYAYDCSEADIQSRVFKENDEAKEICKEQIKEKFFEENNDIEDPITEEEFEEFIESLVFYVYTGKSKPKNIHEAIRLTRGKSFWSPRYVWIQGSMHDTYYTPAKDKNGRITAVRF